MKLPGKVAALNAAAQGKPEGRPHRRRPAARLKRAIGAAAYAIDDSCPHAGGSLSNGKLQGTRVTCPVHGLKFDLDNVSPPGAPTLEVKKYPLQVVAGMVMLTVPDKRSQNDHSTPLGKDIP